MCRFYRPLTESQIRRMRRFLPFEPSTARRLMAVASDSRITNRAHGHVLPPSWRSLYKLTKLPDKPFETGIADGTICPGMKRSEISAMLRALSEDEGACIGRARPPPASPAVSAPLGPTLHQRSRARHTRPEVARPALGGLTPGPRKEYSQRWDKLGVSRGVQARRTG